MRDEAAMTEANLVVDWSNSRLSISVLEVANNIVGCWPIFEMYGREMKA